MNRKLFSLLTAGVLALLSSCGDSIVDATITTPEAEPAPNQVQTKASLSVVVLDKSTAKPIAATVTLLGTGETETASAETGTAVFDSLFAGSYELLVSAEGYASSIINASVASTATENILVAQASRENVQLYPLSAKLSGALYYADNNGAIKPAIGATVALIISDNLEIAEERTSTTTVGTDGKYEFAGLPAVSSSYRLVALEYASAEGTAYGSQSICNVGTCGELVASGVVYNNYTLSNTNIDELFIVLGYSNYIANTDSAVIAFSSPVDLKKVNAGTVTLSTSVGSDLAWNAKGDTLTIKPTGKWNANFTVNLSGLRSVNDKSLSSNSSISIIVNLENISDEQVAGLSLRYASDSTNLDYNSTSTNIKWNKVEGATGYRIYRKTKNDEIYSLVNTVSNGDTFANVSFNGQINGDIVRFKVQAYNSQRQTSLADATELQIRDLVKPSVANQESKINNRRFVRFGYNDWAGGENSFYGTYSYLYGFSNGYSTTNYYAANVIDGSGTIVIGLDSTQLGFYSDLGYYLTQETAYNNGLKNQSDINAYGNNFGSNLVNTDLIAGCTAFNEPMDVNAPLTVAGMPDRASLNLFWSNYSESTEGRVLCYTIKVAAATEDVSSSVEAINSTISISGLKDKAGNSLEISYISSSYGVTGVNNRNTLDFHIKSAAYVR